MKCNNINISAVLDIFLESTIIKDGYQIFLYYNIYINNYILTGFKFWHWLRVCNPEQTCIVFSLQTQLGNYVAIHT